MNREKLPEQLEIISNILDNEKIVKIIEDVNEKTTSQMLNIKVIKVLAEAMKDNSEDMERLAMLHTGKTKEEIDKLPDSKYASLLRTAIVVDVLGFFG